jgi:LacI family transcriptional regulator
MVKCLHGIAAYARQRARWVVEGSPEHDYRSIAVEDLRQWQGDGVLAFVTNPRQARIARGLSIPVVNLSGALEDPGLPRVRSDFLACGRLAAEHLLERGFRRFAYYGLKRIWFSRMFLRGFRERLGPDVECSYFESPSNIDSRRPFFHAAEDLEAWLRTLRPPVGLLTSHDPRARMAAAACERLGLRVPGDVAILGVNNDELICETCDPPLTSVARNPERIGWEAAEMLDRLMTGKRLPAREVEVPPEGVVARASTDVNVIGDPVVSAAARLIQERAGQPLDIRHIVNGLPRSRRWLEQRFRDCLGMSPHEYLCRTRVKMAEALLAQPAKPLYKQVALQCGFHDARRLRIVFQRYVGMTPAEYRRHHLRPPATSDGASARPLGERRT